MAVTHADLEPSHRRTHLSSKTGVCLMVFTILLGLSCFVLCLMAEATRSEVSWMRKGGENNGKGGKSECVYSGSGKVPLLYAACAFVGLTIAMIVEHAYMLTVVSKSSPNLLSWDPYSASARSLTWQAGFFFVTTWMCFAAGEIVILGGVSVESGHLTNWSKPRPKCVMLPEGVFSAAGVLGLATVVFSSGLYLTIFRHLHHNVRTHVLHSSSDVYASSPPSTRPHPPHVNVTITAFAAHDDPKSESPSF